MTRGTVRAIAMPGLTQEMIKAPMKTRKRTKGRAQLFHPDTTRRRNNSTQTSRTSDNRDLKPECCCNECEVGTQEFSSLTINDHHLS
jgi:hypothetical protein